MPDVDTLGFSCAEKVVVVLKMKARLVKEYAEEYGVLAAVGFAVKLLGLDEQTGDEEIWRTNEEGRHFKLETETGEIKAGFGGKFNGMKIGTSWKDGGSMVGPPKPPEQPKAPEKPAEPPKPKGPNYDWYTPSMFGGPTSYMSGALGHQGTRQYSKEEFIDMNQRFLDLMKYGKPSPNEVTYYGMYAIKSLRSNMGLGISRLDKPSKEMLDRLTDDEKQRMLDFVNKFKPKSPYSMENKPFERLEDVDYDTFISVEERAARVNGNQVRSAEAKRPFQDYILLQEKMMLGAEPSEHDTQGEIEKQKKDAAKQAEKAKRDKIKAEQQAFRNSDAAKVKAEKISRIKALDVESFAAEDVETSEIERQMDEAGFFVPERHFVALSGVPKQAYVDAARAYKQVVERFPFLAGEMYGFGDNYDSKNANAGCRKYPERGAEIAINRYRFMDHKALAETRRLSELAGFKVPVSHDVSAEQATITHELGHAVANWLHRAVYGEFKKTSGYYDNDVATLLRDRTMKALGLKVTPENIKQEVSEYAAASRTNKNNYTRTKADEFFAECFCELMCSKKPRRAALEFGRQLDRFIAENGIDGMTTAFTESTFPRLAD